MRLADYCYRSRVEEESSDVADSKETPFLVVDLEIIKPEI
jgi:hypothetical protein